MKRALYTFLNHTCLTCAEWFIRRANWFYERIPADFEHYPEADPFRLMDYCPQGGVKMNKRKMEKWL